MQKELKQWYLKLLKWSILTLIFMISRPFIAWRGFELVIVGGVIYCLFIFGVCVWLQYLTIIQK
ncbi:hypothetical protein [Liquorilactobacillus sicerae]|uniref:hypothetical protein n=1 Tax=Liquorilactobacillus sicerae TaxID=1416943 RepID=UPI0024806242|nr:hypothetical protein [Liquorilactobacillus sicerae]